MTSADLSATQARTLALAAQGFHGVAGRPRSPSDVLERVAGVQLDTISVLARSHELACYARLGAVGRTDVEDALWGVDRDGRPRAFEYWAHAACVLPLDLWPVMAFRRRRYRAENRWSLQTSAEALDVVLRRLQDDGPLTASQLGGAKNGGPWWDWSPLKVAVELLLDRGDVVCTTRRGWKRVYDLTERALPADMVVADPDDGTCLTELVRRAGAAHGVATVADLAEYFRLRKPEVVAVLPDTGLVPVTVEGWAQPAWADPAALEGLGRRGRHRTTLLSPFDSLIWDRPRTERLFGFSHRLEAYTPAHKRVHGYYAMPVLAGGGLVGRVDPGRAGDTLVAKRVTLAGVRAVEPTAEALREAAGWVGASNVAVGDVVPEHLRPALEASLTA